MKIIMQKSDFEQIAAYAKEHLPEEACGLIAGVEENETQPDGSELKVRRIQKVYYLTNIDHTNEHFSLDPKEQLAAIKDMRANGLKPLGNWHSHPETPARPSDEDKRLSYDSSATYMIITLMDLANPVLNAYHVEGNEASKEELILE